MPLFFRFNIPNKFSIFVGLLSILMSPGSLFSQCSTTSAPTYTHSCLYDYFTSITASGAGVTSTINVTATGCSNVSGDHYTMQGITTSIGATVDMNISRYTTSYNAYISVYVDWNNNSVYDPTELAGTLQPLSMSTLSTTYSFVVPSCLVTGTNLHMRIMLSETAAGAGAPCTANYGQSHDFYMNVTCPNAPIVTVSPTTSSFCAGGSSNLTASGAGSGGTYSWTPSTGLSASVGSVVTATPSATTVYTVTGTLCSGCASDTAIATVTVYPIPGAISGDTLVCEGSNISLSNSVAGGVWSSSNNTIATVDQYSGIVYGVSAGSITVTYATVPGACIVYKSVRVNTPPSAISGIASVCEGAATTLSNTSPGGVWSCNSTTTATVSTVGITTGGVAGTATISYTPGGCSSAVLTVTVWAMPPPISGPASVCEGSEITLSDALPGGAWSSSNTTLATVNASTGVVKGLSYGGGTLISYTAPGGCTVTSYMNVPYNILTGYPITGISSVCTGSSGAVHIATSSGGSWSSDDPSIAAISFSGTVSGVTIGIVNINYTESVFGCVMSKIITVYQSPGAISGTTSVCAGNSITLSNASTGTWTSSNNTIATVASSTGVVYGVSGGTATITFSTSVGCHIFANITVNTPAAIVGNSAMCVGGTTQLSDATPGGTWTAPGIITFATISSTGLVTATDVGAQTIYYTAGGCATSKVINIYDMPDPITGPSSVCEDTTIALTEGVAGGTWSSSNNSIATVSSTGIVRGLSSGTVTITYSMGGPCFETKSITVNVSPGPISGSSTWCSSSGTPVNFTNSVGGGTWTTNNPAVTISSSGVVTYTTGVNIIVTIYYTIGSCVASRTLHLQPC